MTENIWSEGSSLILNIVEQVLGIGSSHSADEVCGCWLETMAIER